ncbi:hypothetical protein E2542_SST04104 [Spatholobus suberectus]|nr:hypothetical protein E2542_SST04104 [Spatholobus suberectus]
MEEEYQHSGKREEPQTQEPDGEEDQQLQHPHQQLPISLSGTLLHTLDRLLTIGASKCNHGVPFVLEAAGNALHVDNLITVLGIRRCNDFRVQFIDVSEDSEKFPHYAYFIFILVTITCSLSERGKSFTQRLLTILRMLKVRAQPFSITFMARSQYKGFGFYIG